MADGPQALTTSRIALAFETAGARAATPTIYIIAGGKISPTSTKGTTKRRVSGNRDPVLSTRTPETFKVSIPLPALTEDNGLGSCCWQRLAPTHAVLSLDRQPHTTTTSPRTTPSRPSPCGSMIPLTHSRSGCAQLTRCRW